MTRRSVYLRKTKRRRMSKYSKICDYCVFLGFSSLIVVFATLLTVGREETRRPTTPPETCVKMEECPVRYYCIDAKYAKSDENECLCNALVLMHGSNCSETNLVVPIVFGFLSCWCFYVCLSSLQTVHKRLRKRWKINASVSTLTLISLSSAFFVLLCFSNMFTSLGIGNLKILEQSVYPLANCFSGMFAVLAMLNIPMLWMELANARKLTSLTNLSNTKYVVAALAIIYLVASLASYLLLKNLNLFFLLTGIYCILIAGIYLKGASMLATKMKEAATRAAATQFAAATAESKTDAKSSMNLNHANIAVLSKVLYFTRKIRPEETSSRSERESRAQKILRSSRIVSVHLATVVVCLIIGTTCVEIPSSGPVTFITNSFAIAIMMSLYSSLQHYLTGKKFRIPTPVRLSSKSSGRPSSKSSGRVVVFHPQHPREEKIIHKDVV